MAGYLRRCVPIGVTQPANLGGIYDYRTAPNPCLYKQSQTKWIRMWADWPSCQPNSWDNPASSGVIAALDDQIRRAKGNGLKVMLTSYRFPAWTNTNPYSEEDRAGKTLEFRVPADLSVDGPSASGWSSSSTAMGA